MEVVNNGPTFDLFLSHRQLTGGPLAMNIKLLLLQRDPSLQIFLGFFL